jgi:hypothetical protein
VCGGDRALALLDLSAARLGGRFPDRRDEPGSSIAPRRMPVSRLQQRETSEYQLVGLPMPSATPPQTPAPHAIHDHLTASWDDVRRGRLADNPPTRVLTAPRVSGETSGNSAAPAIPDGRRHRPDTSRSMQPLPDSLPTATMPFDGRRPGEDSPHLRHLHTQSTGLDRHGPADTPSRNRNAHTGSCR